MVLPKRISKTYSMVIVGIVVSLLLMAAAWFVPALFPSEFSTTPSSVGNEEIASAIRAIKVNFSLDLFEDSRLKSLRSASQGLEEGRLGRSNPFASLPATQENTEEESSLDAFSSQ